MGRVYFKNDYQGRASIPKAMWWYINEIGYKGIINAEFCNNLLNNEMKDSFEKYPEELTTSRPITEEDIKFYKKELTHI